MTNGVNIVVSEDVLVANSSAKAGQAYSPPTINHRGITFARLKGLSGCVRKAQPDPFPGSFEAWVGKQVKFALTGTSFEVTRTIKSISVKPIEDVSPNDLEGTLAEIAMRELGLPFKEFFRQAYGDQATAMVIRLCAA